LNLRCASKWQWPQSSQVMGLCSSCIFSAPSAVCCGSIQHGLCIVACPERRSYQRQQCAEGYTGNLCANCARARDGARYGFYTAFTCTRCKSDATLVRGSLFVQSHLY